MDEKFEDIKNKGLEKGKEGFEKVSNLAEPLAKKLGIKPCLFVGIAGGIVALVILICIITCAARPSKEERALIASYKLLGMSTGEAKKAIRETKAAAKKAAKALNSLGDASSSNETSSKPGKVKGITLEKPEDFFYELTSDGKGVKIKSIKDPKIVSEVVKVIIPATIEDMNVTEIDGLTATEMSGPWENVYISTSLKVIELPNTIEVIRSGAFSGCSSLESINLPPSLKKILSRVFWECSALKSIEIPDSVNNTNNTKSIEVLLDGYGMFSGCKSLVSVKLPDGIDCIDQEMFKGCESLKEIHIPDSVKYIWSDAFGGCTSLETVNLPNSIEDIGSFAFGNCKSLKNLIIGENIKSIHTDCSFEGCTSLPLKTQAKLQQLGYTDSF